MLRYTLRRALLALLVAFTVSVATFLLLHTATDPAQAIAGPDADAATVQQVRVQHGFDRPLAVQYAAWLRGVVRGELGESYIWHRQVSELLAAHAPVTIALALSAMLITVVIAIPLGIVAAMRPNTIIDRIALTLAVTAQAVPSFWLGLMLIVLFSVYFDLLPSGGMMTIGSGKTGLALALDIARHLVLPATTLGLFYVAIYARLMRASMLEVYNLDFITTARAKGLTEGRIAWTHAFRNALLPVVTLAGVQFGHLLGGSILVETVFAWPGLGRLVFDALLQRDLNLLLGILFVSSVVVILANLIVDLTYGFLDPRIVHK